MMKIPSNRWFLSTSPVAANVSMKSLFVEKMISMAIVPNIRETPLTEVSMDNKNWERLQYIEDRLQDPHISWAETQKLLNEKQFLIEDNKTKNTSHLQFEISIAWDDDDEFEHEGYYNSVDDAIEALLKYKNEH